MNLENQVCSLELSKQLKELGVNQDSLFYYQNNPYNDGEECIDLMITERKSVNNENVIINTECENNDNPKYSAFTLEEIFKLLPNKFIKYETITNIVMKDEIMQESSFVIPHRYHLKMMYVKDIENGHWSCIAFGQGYDNFGLMISEVSFSEHAKTAVDASAKMLIYLIKERFLK